MHKIGGKVKLTWTTHEIVSIISLHCLACEFFGNGQLQLQLYDEPLLFCSVRAPCSFYDECVYKESKKGERCNLVSCACVKSWALASFKAWKALQFAGIVWSCCLVTPSALNIAGGPHVCLQWRYQKLKSHGVPFLCHYCMLLIRGASSWACLSKLRNRHVDLFDMFSMDHCCKVRSQYTRQAYSVSHLEMYLKFQTKAFHLSVILLLH